MTKTRPLPNRPLILWCLGVALGASGRVWAGQREERLVVARAYWDRLVAARTAEAVLPSGPYPTEAAIPLLTAYAQTREQRFAELATRQLAQAHRQERAGMVLLPSAAFPSGHRDAQARHIYNFYLAYRVLGEGQYLHWADAAAEAMVRSIPRALHEVAGETHRQFAASVVNLETPAATPPIYAVDVNQNAEIGLAFSLLYHDPASAFFAEPVAREIALEETLASMSLQDMATGAIPLTEGDRLTQYDTAYASYAGFSWVWSQLLWRDARLEAHIRAAGKWLAGKMDLKQGSDRYYPFRNPSLALAPWEASYRIPLYWYCGTEPGRYIAGLFERMPTEDILDPMVAPWAYFDLMGIPRDYYLDGVAKAAPPDH